MTICFKPLLCFLTLVLCLAGCAAPPTAAPTASPAATVAPTAPQPSAPSAPAAPVPSGDRFSDLPLHAPGELLRLGEYTIQIGKADVQQDHLVLQIHLENASAMPVDLLWALQVRDDQGNLLSPDLQTSAPGRARNLEARAALDGDWVYTLSGAEAPDLAGYRLVFAPRGWSGPVAVFRLVP